MALSKNLLTTYGQEIANVCFKVDKIDGSKTKLCLIVGMYNIVNDELLLIRSLTHVPQSTISTRETVKLEFIPDLKSKDNFFVQAQTYLKTLSYFSNATELSE